MHRRVNNEGGVSRRGAADDSDESDAEFLKIIKNNSELTARYRDKMRSFKGEEGRNSKEVKSRGDNIMRNIKDISLPKVKKVIDRIMKKRYAKKFFKKTDWVTEILDKLNVKKDSLAKNKVAYHIKMWIECEENFRNQNSNQDSKKGILDQKDSILEKKSQIMEGMKKMEKSEVVENEEENEVFLIIPPVPKTKCIECKKVLDRYTICSCISRVKNNLERIIPFITIE